MLPSRVVKLPFLGEYEGCFTRNELVNFLKVEVEGFGGSEGRANDAGRELVENLGLVRRIVAVGKGTWGGGGEEFYQFTDKVSLKKGARFSFLLSSHELTLFSPVPSFSPPPRCFPALPPFLRSTPPTDLLPFLACLPSLRFSLISRWRAPQTIQHPHFLHLFSSHRRSSTSTSRQGEEGC